MSMKVPVAAATLALITDCSAKRRTWINQKRKQIEFVFPSGGCGITPSIA
tara:strand:- start:337 stop:486 length:150 start_codon:yes stop_codon:yes gene_type:complete